LLDNGFFAACLFAHGMPPAGRLGLSSTIVQEARVSRRHIKALGVADRSEAVNHLTFVEIRK
jgi:hypothetical protein